MKVLKHLIILAVSIVLTLSTIFIPVRVPNKLAMRSVELGYPIHYYSQDLSRLDPPSFPRKYPLQSPWEYPFRISTAKFIGNVFTYFLLLQLIVYGISIFFIKAALSPIRPINLDQNKRREKRLASLILPSYWRR